MSKQRGLPTTQQLEAEMAERQRELGLTKDAPPAPPKPTVTVTEDAPKPAAATTVLSKVGQEELEARLLAAGLKLDGGSLQLLKPETITELEHVERPPPHVRRRIPKNRTGTYRNPYPLQNSDRETIKTSFNLDAKARKELDLFFAELGPQRRNLWAEQVLLQAARRTRKAWAKRQQLEPDQEPEGEGGEGEAQGGGGGSSA